MILALSLLASLLIYFIILMVYGGKYSFYHQEIKSLLRIVKIRAKRKEDVTQIADKINQYKNALPKIKQHAYLFSGLLFIAQIFTVLFTLNAPLFYFIMLGGYLLFLGALQVVFWLKGSGTIDDNARIPGGPF